MNWLERKYRGAAWAVLAGALLLSASAVPVELYGSAYNGAGGAATLYSINRTTGAASSIGAIGFNQVSAMDFASDGTLYAIGRRPADGESVLITIDPATGAGTEVGPTGITSLAGGGFFTNVSDVSFSSSGTLFAYLEPNDGLGTVDLATGAITFVGFTASGAGNAMAFGSDGTTLNQFNVFDWNTLDTSTGAATFQRSLIYTYPVDSNTKPNAADRSGDTFYVSLNDGNNSAPENYLALLCSDGYLANLGRTVNGLDALAVAPSTTAPTLGSGDLAISNFSVSPSSVALGDQATFTLDLSNNAASANAAGVAFIELPDNVTYVSSSPSQGSCSLVANVVQCALGNLDASATATVDVTVTLDSGSGAGVNAGLGGAYCDTSSGDNSSSAFLALVSADLSITKFTSAKPKHNGSQIVYTVTLANNGPDAAQDVVVTDPVPTGTSFVSTSSGSCSFSSGTVTCSLGTMNAFTEISFTITVSVTALGKSTITNTVSVTSSTNDPNSSDNSSTVTSRVVGKPK